MNIANFIKESNYKKFKLDKRQYKIGRVRGDFIDCKMIGCSRGVMFPLPIEMTNVIVNGNIVEFNFRKFEFLY